MADGHVCSLATVLPTETSGDPAAAGVYTSAAPRPSVPGAVPASGLTAPGAVPAPGVAASPAPRRTPQGIPASPAGRRRGS